MKHAKRDPILKELLADDPLEAVRRRSLEQGMAIARRRRQCTNWAKGGIVSALLVATICVLIPTAQRPFARNKTSSLPLANPAMVTTVAPAAKNAAVVRFISDDELLALFPGRPLALIGPPGHKELVVLEEPLLNNRDDHDEPSLSGAIRRVEPTGAE